MNRKKIASVILTSLIISTVLPKDMPLADVENSTALNDIITSNSQDVSFANISNNLANLYTVTASDDSCVKSITTDMENNSAISKSIDIVSTKNSEIIINLHSSNTSVLDSIKSIKNVVSVNKNSNYAPNVESASSNDFNTDFYINSNSKYLKVNSFKGIAVIPTVSLTSNVLTNAKYLNCKVTTTDNSSHTYVKYYTFTNLTPGNYELPSIDTSNIKSISVDFNVVDSSENILKKSTKTINKSTSTPAISIKNASINTNNDGSTSLTLKMLAADEQSDDLLSTPVVYLNDKKAADASVNYDDKSGTYTVQLNIPASYSNWNLQFFAADDSLDVANASLSSDALININNKQNGIVYYGKDNIIRGTLPQDNTISNVKANNSTVHVSSNQFSFTNSSSNILNFTYNYGKNNTPIDYTIGCYSYTTGPTFNNIAINSNTVKNSDNAYLASNKLNLTGNISSFLTSGLAIKSVQYTYKNHTPVDVPYSFDNNNLTISNFIVPNDDECTAGNLKIVASDALNNTSDFYVSVYAASGVNKPATTLNSDTNSTNNYNGFNYYIDSVTPAVNTYSNPLLNLINSTFKLDKYEDSNLNTLVKSVIYNFKDINLINSSGIFSFSSPLLEGVYELTTTLTDIGGNNSSNIVKFIVDKTPPKINITNKNDPIKPSSFFSSNNFTEDTLVSDVNFKSATSALYKDNVLQGTYNLSNNSISKNLLKSDGVYTIKVNAEDEAGNKSSNETTFTLDTTAPTAFFNNINDNQYYSKLINPEVNVTEKNIDLSNSYFDVVTNDGLPARYYFTDNNVVCNKLNSDNAIYTLSNIINSDGKYNITVHIADLAGNTLSSDISSTFYEETSDVTPAISGVSDGENTPNTVVPTIKINDFFLNQNDIGQGKSISATLNGQPYNLKFESKDGETLTLVGDPISANSLRGQKYTLSVAASSLSDPNAPKTTTVNFVVDNEAPTIDFSDANGRNIQNGNYYNGTVNPVIRLSDNYSISNYSITINGHNYSGDFATDSNGNITFTGNPLTQDGNYTICASVTDETGNTCNYQTSFTMDNSAPSINISGVENGEDTNNLSVTPNVSIYDKNLDYSKIHFNVTKDGVPIDISPNSSGDLYSFSLYDEGNYSLSVTAEDKAGNIVSTTPINFTIDRTAPILNFNYTNGEYINKFFRPSITTENKDDFICKLIINGIEYSPFDIPLLSSDGVYEIIAQGKDKAGNLSNLSTRTFTIDTTFPIINVQNLIADFYYNRNISPFIQSTDTNLSSFSMTLNGVPYNNEPITADGNYELVITSIDKAGNVSRKVVDFVIDKTAPIISIEGVINFETLRQILIPLIQVNDPNAQITILLDGEDYHGGAITTDGKHTLIIEAVDKAGNISKKTITFFLKVTPPSIYVSGIKDGEKYKDSVTPAISFSNDVVSNDTVMTLDGKAYKQGDKISDIGDHELYISVQDAAGNITTKKIKFTITSSNVISAAVHKILHKILPSQIVSSKKSISVFLISILSILTGILGLAILKIQKLKKIKKNKA